MWTKQGMSPLTTSTAPPAEIETFKRRKFAIIPFILSGVNIILVWSMRPLYRYSWRINAGLFFSCLSILTLIHLVYTAILMLAPRFLFRGVAWIKAAPWIISSAGLFTIYFFKSPTSVFGCIYCILGFLIQLTQFVVCVLPEENVITFIFKPFEKRMIPNLLAKIDLTDPNARLDTIYGPPLTIPSSVPGQHPAVVRYGSQAVKIQPQQPIELQSTTSYYQPSTPSFPPAYAPPVYEATANYSEKSPITGDKSQYDIKK